MSLARGLDYYTGIIFEAITSLSAPPSASSIPATNGAKTKRDGDEPDESSVGVGSIAGGGRYDNLVGMFSEAAGQKAQQVPCVGFSVGVERVFAILQAKGRGAQRGNETEVFVLSLGGGLLKERMRFVKTLRDNGIKVGSMRWVELIEGGIHV